MATEFNWTLGLRKEFASLLIGEYFAMDVEQAMNKFKQSHTPTEQKPIQDKPTEQPTPEQAFRNPHFKETEQPKERIEVRNFYHECHVVKGHEYVVEVSGTIQPEKFPAIKQAIEEILNQQKQ